MNPMVQLAASAQPGEKKYVLFAGAGVSKDAGIPTAWDLMRKTAALLYAEEASRAEATPEEIDAWFLESPHAKTSYADLIGKLYPSSPEQQSFLKSFLQAKQPGRAHELIAELVRRNIIRAIVTTNFDTMIEKALEAQGLEHQVISNDHDLENSEPLIHCKAVRIYKPHGTLGRGQLKNTPKDLESLSTAMEAELTRVLSEHGVLVLGYSGQDEGIQKVFRSRNRNLYPMFWADPVAPKGAITEVLLSQSCIHIGCSSAAQFIGDYLELLARIKDLSPEVGAATTLSDLKYAYAAGKAVGSPKYKDFADGVIADLKATRPDFSRFAHADDAIVDQVERGISISHRWIEAAILAARNSDSAASQVLYESFAKVMELYEAPKGSRADYGSASFDGFKFLGYEMFLGFTAAMIRENKWDQLGELLGTLLFTDVGYKPKYLPYTEVCEKITSIDVHRNNRLNLSRASVVADLFKARFSNPPLGKLLSHREIIEADYFLFMRSAALQETPSGGSLWRSGAAIYLDEPPSYLYRAESKKFLITLAKAAGFADYKAFLLELHTGLKDFTKLFPNARRVENPLLEVELHRLGAID